MATTTDTTTDTTNPIMKLVQSSKFLIVLVVCILTFVGVFKGAMTWKDANDFLRWIIGPWLLAQGLVDASTVLAPAASPSQSGSIPGIGASSAVPPATSSSSTSDSSTAPPAAVTTPALPPST